KRGICGIADVAQPDDPVLKQQADKVAGIILALVEELVSGTAATIKGTVDRHLQDAEQPGDYVDASSEKLTENAGTFSKWFQAGGRIVSETTMYLQITQLFRFVAGCIWRLQLKGTMPVGHILQFEHTD
ncbi:hypothetical protein H4R20_007122, partial [Coemansia guatemalensis]